jgi:hypothetical protein
MADSRDWLFQRAVARVEAPVEQIVADFATSYAGRPAGRVGVGQASLASGEGI